MFLRLVWAWFQAAAAYNMIGAFIVWNNNLLFLRFNLLPHPYRDQNSLVLVRHVGSMGLPREHLVHYKPQILHLVRPWYSGAFEFYGVWWDCKCHRLASSRIYCYLPLVCPVPQHVQVELESVADNCPAPAAGEDQCVVRKLPFYQRQWSGFCHRNGEQDRRQDGAGALRNTIFRCPRFEVSLSYFQRHHMSLVYHVDTTSFKFTSMYPKSPFFLRK